MAVAERHETVVGESFILDTPTQGERDDFMEDDEWEGDENNVIFRDD